MTDPTADSKNKFEDDPYHGPRPWSDRAPTLGCCCFGCLGPLVLIVAVITFAVYFSEDIGASFWFYAAVVAGIVIVISIFAVRAIANEVREGRKEENDTIMHE